MNTVANFVAALNLTMKVTQMGSHVIDGKTPFKWHVTISFGNKKYSCEYTMDAAHVGTKLLSGKFKRVDYYHIKNRRVSNRALVPMEPELNEVLDSLKLDCFSIENNPLWKDWAREMGYNDDSIKEKKIFKACRQEYLELKTFFRDKFETFLNLESE